MKPEIIKKLNQLNQQFYEVVAESFDQTRQQPWAGWQKLVPFFQQEFASQTAITVLDLGCGNGRFGEFLVKNLPDKTIHYTGVDSNEYLLGKAKIILEDRVETLQLIKADIFDFIPNQKYDLVIAFGVLHHIPSIKLRQEFIAKCASVCKPKGLVALAAWQFDAGMKMITRAVSSITVDILPTELEDNDYILPWERDVKAYRYSHLIKPVELSTIVPNNIKPLTSFLADGKEQKSNYYVLFKKI